MKRPLLFLLSFALLLSVGCATREAAVLQPVATASVLPLQPGNEAVAASADDTTPVPTEQPAGPAPEPTPAAEQPEAPAAGVVVYSAPDRLDLVVPLPEDWTYTDDGDELLLYPPSVGESLLSFVTLSSLSFEDEEYLGFDGMLDELTDLLTDDGGTVAPFTDVTVGGQYAGRQTDAVSSLGNADVTFSLHIVMWETDSRFYLAFLTASAEQVEGGAAVMDTMLDGFMTAQAYLDAEHTAPEPTPVPEIAAAEDDPYTLPTPTPAETVSMALDNAVLVDEGGIKATVLGFTEGWFGPSLSLELTNAANRTVTFTIDRPAVNGYMLDTMSLYATVPAGKTVTQEVSIYDSELARCGIEKIAVVEISLRVTAELWDTVYVSPRLRLETEAAQTYTQTYADKGKPVYDADGLTVLFTGLETDAWFGQTVVLTFVNASDRSLAVSLRDCAINGIPAETLFSVILMPGTRAVSVCYFSPEVGSSFGDEYRTGAFGFHIYDAETYDTLADAAPVEITFE